MLPFALESAGSGSERYGIKRPPGGKEMMLEIRRWISRRLERVVRGLRRRGRKARRRRRSHMVGGGWTRRILNQGSTSKETRRTSISSVKTGSKSSILPSKKG